MREYGRIKVQFWTDAKILRLSPQSKLLFAYLLTGPHANGIGCFRLPFGYIEADMGWVPATVTQTLSELLREGLIERCDKTGWMLIVNYLKHNPIDNPNVAKGAIGQIHAVPPSLPFYSVFTEKLKPYAERFPMGFITRLEVGMPECVAEIETDPEVISIADMDIGANALERACETILSLADIDIDAGLHVWNDLASELGLPLVQRLTDGQRAKLRARLSDVGGVVGWAAVLVKIRDSRFLRGHNKENWRATLDFVLHESSFNKLKEGGYNDKKTPEVSIIPHAFTLPPNASSITPAPPEAHPTSSI